MNKELYDLTNPQKSIWLTEQFYKDSPISNVSGTLSLNEQLDFKLLERAINIFIKNNDGIRLQITLVNNVPKQYVADYNFNNIDIINVRDQVELDSIVDSTISNPIFSLDAPLYKFTMFRYPNGNGGFFAVADHMVSDAWSTSLVVNNITNIYLNLKNNIDIGNNTTSYIDYIKSEENYKKSTKYISDQNYWEEKYSIMPEVASFAPQSNKKTISTKAERIKFIIPKANSDKIMDFCKENKISAFTFFILIYSLYLGRVSNMEKINVGTPILNRINASEKKCIGMFVNTLPFQVSLSPNSTFIDCANNLSLDELSVLRHQKYPYIELLRSLRSKFHSDSGLYDFVLSYQNARANIDDSKISYHTDWNFNHNISETLNVHITDMDSTNAFNVLYDYQISKLSRQDIELIHNRILYLIEQVLQDPNRLISNFDIVTKNEEENILYNFNETGAKYPDKKTISDLFEEQVLKTPHNIAVKINNESITYEDLNKQANSFAHTLRSFGIVSNMPVAIRMSKSINMIVAILGIIKAGGCYLPIDLSYPQERIDFMLKDSSCKFFITDSLHINDIIIDSTLKTINIDDRAFFSEDVANLNSINTPDDTIYIIYTSGSTGTPKGVVLSHRNVVRLLKNDKFLFDFSENDVWTMFHSVAFDFSVWEMYGALLFGGKLVLVPEVTAKDPLSFLKLLRDEKVTILNQTPTFFYNLQDLEMLQPDSNLKIRYIIYGGEALKPNLIKPWKDKYPFTKLINMYGITETTVHVTFRELTQEDLTSSDPIIGKPIPTLKVYIMNNNQKLMPYGVEGEICVAGLGVCKGYLNRPELNKSKFVNNPYIPGEVLYRSADSGYLDTQNNLHYIGRIDNQVKIRGFRVELGEIESKLLTHPFVTKCVVLPSAQNDKDSFLVAYIVANAHISSSDLKEYMSKLVPAYMVPNYFVMLDTLPLTSNGKVDRKKLLTIPITLERETNYVEPTTDFQKILAKAIVSNLNIEKIGINDDIISLGADSLSLMKITIYLLEKGISLNIQNFYEYKTIANIEKHFYNAVDSKLRENNHVYNNFDESFSDKKISISNVLLTGSTGFLGSHILRDLLNSTDYNIYCLIRDKNGIPGEKRLMDQLHKYFGNSLDKHLHNRLNIINGDIIKLKLGLSDKDYSYYSNIINTVIHSAAIVSHYGSHDVFWEINVSGTKNIIDFCKNNNIFLNHISTLSVSGNFINATTVNEKFNEHSIYIGQDVSSNVYLQSKLEAEMEINKELNNGLRATIYRLGNITARLSDCMFQDNFKENAFLNRILSFINLKIFPKTLLDFKFDLSPVDMCSKFITTLFEYADSYGKIFHINNNNSISFNELLSWLDYYGYNIQVLDDNNFKNEILRVSNENNLLGIINDITNTAFSRNQSIVVDSSYTDNILAAHGLYWNIPNKEYFYNFIKKFL